MGGFEILEHTADVGVRARGDSLHEVFEQAAHGLLDITGATGAGRGERVDITVDGPDVAAVLADWLEEVLYQQDARDAVVTGLKVEDVSQTSASGWIEIGPRDEDLEGTAVKAITLHQLEVAQRDDRWVAQVYLDI